MLESKCETLYIEKSGMLFTLTLYTNLGQRPIVHFPTNPISPLPNTSSMTLSNFFPISKLLYFFLIPYSFTTKCLGL